MKSIKEYTKFIGRKCDYDFEDEEIDKLMMDFGFQYNQEVEE